MRFSKDKSPYKTHAASWFKHRNAGHGVGSETHGGGAGYYFHLEPGECRHVALRGSARGAPPRGRVTALNGDRPVVFGHVEAVRAG